MPPLTRQEERAIVILGPVALEDIPGEHGCMRQEFPSFCRPACFSISGSPPACPGPFTLGHLVPSSLSLAWQVLLSLHSPSLILLSVTSYNHAPSSPQSNPSHNFHRPINKGDTGKLEDEVSRTEETQGRINSLEGVDRSSTMRNWDSGPDAFNPAKDITHYLERAVWNSFIWGKQGLEEMKKLLLLLLGCAVQCQKKEEYIEKIQCLDFDTKAVIASHIQEVTQNQENVFDLQWLEVDSLASEDLDTLSRSMAFHLKQLVDKRDEQQESPSGSPRMHRTESRQHLSVELADAKAKIRRLRQELQLPVFMKGNVNQNMQLLSDARSARAYRDELDALREKAFRVDKLESEVGRYKDRLHDIEFYKARVEVWRHGYHTFLQCPGRESYEAWVEVWGGGRAITEFYNAQERDMDRKRIEELLEENLSLEVAQKQSMDESLHLGWELEQLSKTPEIIDALQRSLEELRRGGEPESSQPHLLRAQQDNHRLTQKRSQISTEARVKDVEKENKVLHESIKETSAKLSKAEFDHKQLHKELELQRERGERAEDLELELRHLKRENEGLQKRMASLGITCQRVELLEHQNAELEAETRRLKKKLDGLKGTMLQLEALEKDNAQLEEENLELRRSVEALRPSSLKLAQLEMENRELEAERSQLQRSLELQRASNKKTERLEASCQGLDMENQRLQKALENSSRKIQQLEDELHDVELENQSLQRSLEELRISSKRLEQLEKEHGVLEQENSQLEKYKKQLEKENKRLRQQAEVRDASLDDSNTRVSHLEKENRALTRELCLCKESCGRLRDLEKDNKEMVKQATIDKKTLVTLREELVNEKLKTQQMNNDLEKLTHELEKIGLNKERLLQDEQSSDQRYANLTCQLNHRYASNLSAALQVKKNYEALQQREEEERMVQSSQPRSGEEVHVTSKRERESHKATRELLKVKDRLIEVERNSANLQEQILALQRQTATLQENNTSLQTQNARLQVENSTLSSQSAALMAQNAQLQNQQCTAESEREGALQEREDLRSTHELLLRDHEKLAALHERQATEYEALIAKHGSLKMLQNEQEKMISENQNHKATAAQYQQLQEKNHKCGNLEEENRHLLDQIQNLMLQNRTLLEQTMESKDLFHVEQRQYIDKLNELRRQKEKLEEKIMDQYKFYDPSPPRRRGNWITLKMKKLMKPKSRERMRSLPLSPSRSESSDGILPHPDSQDSSSVGSGSLDDTLNQKRSSTMNDLLHSLALAGGTSSENLDVPEENSAGRRRRELGSLAFSTTAINYSSLSLPKPRPTAPASITALPPSPSFGLPKLSKWGSWRARGPPTCCKTLVSLSDCMHVTQQDSTVRHLSLDNEGWSSGSSPVQQPPSQRSAWQSPQNLPKSLEPPAQNKGPSPGSQVVSLQQFLQEGKPTQVSIQEAVAAETPPLSCKAPPPGHRELAERGLGGRASAGRGILRSASGSAGSDSEGRSPKHGPGIRPPLRKAESSRVRGPTPRPSFSGQGKASSVSERLNSGSAGPTPKLLRASSMISSNEGPFRRTSIHDFMAKDSRAPVSVDPAPAKATLSEYIPARPLMEEPSLTSPPPPTPPPLGSSFIDSVFMDTIFSESAFPGPLRNQAFLSLNPSLVSNISGPPTQSTPRLPTKSVQSHSSQPHEDIVDITADGHLITNPQLPVLSSEDKLSLWYEYGCV
ncbi:hypothetical protein JZ751_003601 [Albula glossodonta]|uniref:HOOK N-terminal domain-containing protein n=1 Tax=Albula glossodonta TaxID=121402 RepID=A0A8T2N7C4_9TELE|nr:hypothetical protein JZ751_003601 [Albula glossodonta]